MPCSDDTESIAREKILMRAKTCALAAELQKMVEHVPAVEEWRRIKMSLSDKIENAKIMAEALANCTIEKHKEFVWNYSFLAIKI